VSVQPSRRLSLLACAAIILLMGAAMADELARGFPPDFAARLATAKEIYVATQRKDGTRSAVVPVWFGLMDNAIWFTTSPDSHKVKRIRHGSPLFVSVESKHGPFIKTKVEIIKDGALADRLGDIYKQKYWIAWLGFFRPSRARNESGKTVLLKLTPEE
jgi:hypothetical protein